MVSRSAGTQTICMLEWTSIPAASGLTTLSPADEAGTGTGSDLSRDFLGAAGFLGFLGFFGCSFGNTMDASGWRVRVVKQQGAASQEGYRGRLKSPQRDQHHAGKNQVWRVANDKVEASRATLTIGHEAPAYVRPLTASP